MNTLLTNSQELKINPPRWETALYFLDIYTQLEAEFNQIELLLTDMFDLSHPETQEQLNPASAVRAIKMKASIAKEIIKWLSENKALLDETAIAPTKAPVLSQGRKSELA